MNKSTQSVKCSAYMLLFLTAYRRNPLAWHSFQKPFVQARLVGLWLFVGADESKRRPVHGVAAIHKCRATKSEAFHRRHDVVVMCHNNAVCLEDKIEIFLHVLVQQEFGCASE